MVVVIEGAVKVELPGLHTGGELTSIEAAVFTPSNETIPPEPVNEPLKFHVNVLSAVSPFCAVR